MILFLIFLCADQNTRVVQTIRDLYTTKGLPGLFSGLLPRLIKVVPACAIMVATFEYGKHYFHQKNSHQFTETSKTELTQSSI